MHIIFFKYYYLVKRHEKCCSCVCGCRAKILKIHLHQETSSLINFVFVVYLLSLCNWGYGTKNVMVKSVYLRFCHGIDNGEIVNVLAINLMDKPNM